MSEFRALCLTVALVCGLQHAAFADMPGKFFKQKATTPGLSKILFKMKLKPGDVGLNQWSDLDPCLAGANTPWSMAIQIENAGGSYEQDVDVLASDCALVCATALPGKDKATLSANNCDVKYSIGYDAMAHPTSGKLLVKCVVAAPVDRIQTVRIAFDVGLGEFQHEVCFYDPAFAPNLPATIKKDGSDGKSVKMLDAPSGTCEHP